MRIAFTTLGCKINQYETDHLRQDLESKGNLIVPFDADADVYIINTCSVTAKTDYQCRQVIRSATRRNPGAKVVVTGCYASTRPEELQKIPGVTLVVGNKVKIGIPDRIMDFEKLQETSRTENLSPRISIGKASNRTRGFLKIQDGCDNRCSYCIVPIARGSSRSVRPQDVYREFGRLVASGCPEIVLSGIHIGTYGSDLSEPMGLSDLIRSLVSMRGTSRIRLSSIEPNEINQEILNFLEKGLCRHLHIPLQSGDDSILKAMKRHYTSGFYRDLLADIARKVPGIALGADIMVGFPGEGESEFESTFNLIKESPLTHLHVFSYSPRPGTQAADMKEQVPEPVKKARSEKLRVLGVQKNAEFMGKFTGSELRVVVEDKKNTNTGLLTGLSDNYIRVQILGTNESHIGREIKVRVSRVEKEGVFGILE
jgi:threonylcarbamoyladenosine tRNA methylthiotransferase MtaB